jgi:hypothetical protein
MSIDIAWKIARLFDVDFGRFVSINLSEAKGNTSLLLKFIDKLIQQTEAGELQWEACNDPDDNVYDGLYGIGLLSSKDERLIYHPHRLNQKMRWIVEGDIMRVSNFFDDGHDLVVIPFRHDESLTIHYDFISFWLESDMKVERMPKWKKVFFTFDDPFGKLDDAGAKLVKVINDYELDAKLDSGMRSFIDFYVKDGE